MANTIEMERNLQNKLNENNAAFFNDEKLPHSDDELKLDARNLTTEKVKEKFAEWKKVEDPLKTALEELFVPSYGIKLEEDKDTHVKGYKLDKKSKVFDLAAFCKFCDGKRITHEATFAGKLAVAQVLFAARVAKELGRDYKEILEKHKIPQTVVRKDVTQQKNPISNSTIEGALQALVDAIYWVGTEKTNELKMKSKDVQFIIFRNTRKGKSVNAINTGKARTLCETITIIMHCMMKGLDYQVEFDRIKED